MHEGRRIVGVALLAALAAACAGRGSEPVISNVRRTMVPDDPATGEIDPRVRVMFDIEADLGTSCIITARGPGGGYLGEGSAGPQEGLLETQRSNEDVTALVGLEREVSREVGLSFDCRTAGEWPAA